MKKILILMLAMLAFVFCFTACGEDIDDPTVNAITVTAGSIKTEYEVGDTPDFSGIEAVLTYSDGTAKKVSYNDLKVGEIDMTTAGVKKLKVSYGDAFCEIEITVKEKPAPVVLSSIKIVAGSVATEIYVGEAFDLSKLQVEATYSDGTKKPVNIADVEITNIDTDTVGDKTLTVKYEDKTDSVTVKVSGIASLSLVTGTLNDKIFVGAALDTAGVQVLVTYDNGKSEVVEASALTVGSFDNTTAGEKKLEISYKGAKLEHTVTVVGDKMLTVNAGSVASYVKVKGALDVSGITAKLEYTDGTFKALSASDLSVQNIDTSTAGAKLLKVTYGTLEATYPVMVVGVKSLTVQGIKSEVFVGEVFSTDNISVHVEYTAAIAPETLGKDALTLGSVDTATAGDKKLSVTYLDKTVQIDVKVCGVESIRVDGIDKVLAAGKELDISEMKVFGIYGDSTHKEILLSDGITTNYDDIDFNSEDDKDFVVSYSGEHGSFSVTVKITATAPALEKIEIRTYPKYVILKGAYDKTAITVTAVYANETTETILNDKLVIGDIVTDEAGTKTITVSYTEGEVTKTVECAVEVLPVTALAVSGIANKVNKGEALDTSAISVIVTFSKGEFSATKTVTASDEDLTVSTPDTATGGEKTLTVSYLGFETTVPYYVKAVESIAIFSGLADKVRYGYAVDYSALMLEVKYNDGVEQKKAAELGATVTWDDTKTDAATVKVTVTFDGFTATKDVTVLRVASISALNGTTPASIALKATLPYNLIKLTVTYTNGDVYLVGTDDANLVLSDFNTETAGEKALVFSYMGYETSLRIMVNGIELIALVPGSIVTTVKVGDKLETADIKIRVQYTDSNYIYVDTTNTYLQIGSIDTSTPGTKKLVVSYQGTDLEIPIEVKDVAASGGLIFGALLPDTIVARDTYKKNFKDKEQGYVVGDDNPYYFYLNVLMLDDNDDIVDVDGKSIASFVQVYDVTGAKTLLEGDALTAMVAVNSAKNSYDFTEAAIGRTFEIVVRPAEGYVPGTEDAVTKSHTVTVVDGYNVYEAWELNLITNYDDDLDDGDIEGHNSQIAAVDRFLATKGAVRPAVLGGVVLHCNIDVKESDLPPEYLYTYVKDGVQKKGFYDHISMFNRKLDNTNSSFTLYGNYYSIYTYNLSCIVEKGIANNDDEFSSSEIFRFKPDWHDTTNVYTVNYDRSKYTANVNNVAFRDNDPNSNDQSASERHMRGLICFKITEITANFNNVNIDAYVNSMVIENDHTIVNLNKVKFYNAWQGHIFLWAKNALQQDFHGGKDNEPFEGHPHMVLNITESLIAKCGGPVILSQNADASYNCNKNSGPEINVDKKSELYSYVTGQEAWFVAVGQTALAAQIVALNQPVQMTATAMGAKASYTSNEKIQGVNTVNMVLVNMGVGTSFGGGEDYDGIFKKDGVAGLNMNDDNAMLNTYIQATSGQAPVFQTNAGGTAYFDGSGLYSIDFSTGNPQAYPSGEMFQGDYITLYYMGAGIMLEYYH